MPKIWRGMRRVDDKPETGAGGNLLGVRIGLHESDDIVEEDGYVQPGNGDMSVSPSLETLPPHRMPRRLQSPFPEASGSNQLYCWSMGEGDFFACQVAVGLVLRPDPKAPERHGFVEPERKMMAAVYQVAVAATRDQWIQWEE